MHQRKYSTIFLFIVVILPPLVVWLGEVPPTDRGFSGALRFLSGLTALTALALLSLSLILGLKLRPLDRAMGGLNHQYYVHHLTAAAAFVLLLAHPLLSASALLPVSAAAARGVLFPEHPSMAVFAG